LSNKIISQGTAHIVISRRPTQCIMHVVIAPTEVTPSCATQPAKLLRI